MSEPHAENDADAGLLLHELRNVNDVVYNIDSEIFDELTKWTNVNVRKSLDSL